MRTLIALTIAALPSIGLADSIAFEDGPWIPVPAGMSFQTQMTPMEEIRALADLDGDPTVTTAREIEMIALLTQMLGAQPAAQPVAQHSGS